MFRKCYLNLILMDEDILLIVGVIGGVLIILSAISILIYLFATREEKKTVEEKPAARTVEEPPREPAARTVEEPPREPAAGCPSLPYTYCSRDTIKNVYIVSGCGPSSRIIDKLTNEGKITGENDPKVINCSQNQVLCTAAGITSYPAVICENSPSDIYQGYCE